jgi:hypothetical protein
MYSSNHMIEERLAQMKMQEINREIEQARLLREAGLASGPGLLSRLASALQSLARGRSGSARQPRASARRLYRRALNRNA